MERIQEILARHLSGTVAKERLSAIATEIAELEREWEEIPHVEEGIGADISVQCDDICTIARAYHSGRPIRIFQRRADG